MLVRGFAAAIPAGSTFTFRTEEGSFRNPPTTKRITTFNASSNTPGGAIID